jgi:hypothetical protein
MKKVFPQWGRVLWRKGAEEKSWSLQDRSTLGSLRFDLNESCGLGPIPNLTLLDQYRFRSIKRLNPTGSVPTMEICFRGEEESWSLLDQYRFPIFSHGNAQKYGRTFSSPLPHLYQRCSAHNIKRDPPRISFYIVRGRGLEPPCLAALPPQGSVSANSTIRAYAGSGIIAEVPLFFNQGCI